MVLRYHKTREVDTVHVSRGEGSWPNGRIMGWAQDFRTVFEEAKKRVRAVFIVGSKKALEGYRPLCMNRFFLSGLVGIRRGWRARY